jgi:hypothetical protein
MYTCAERSEQGLRLGIAGSRDIARRRRIPLRHQHVSRLIDRPTITTWTERPALRSHAKWKLEAEARGVNVF